MPNGGSDLTKQEQAHVRAALRLLRVQCGGWAGVEKVIHYQMRTIRNVMKGRMVSPTMAFRVARFFGVGIDDLLAGRFPPRGTCHHCGQVPDLDAT